jgi:hypothetical protein
MNPSEAFKDFVDGIVHAFPTKSFSPDMDLR